MWSWSFIFPRLVAPSSTLETHKKPSKSNPNVPLLQTSFTMWLHKALTIFLDNTTTSLLELPPPRLALVLLTTLKSLASYISQLMIWDLRCVLVSSFIYPMVVLLFSCGGLLLLWWCDKLWLEPIFFIRSCQVLLLSLNLPISKRIQRC